MMKPNSEIFSVVARSKLKRSPFRIKAVAWSETQIASFYNCVLLIANNSLHFVNYTTKIKIQRTYGVWSRS